MNADPRVLIVDDESAFAGMLREMLRSIDAYRSADVSIATSYEQAVAALTAAPCDVALFDYWLGTKDGVALLRDVRARGIDTAVIVLTGHGAEDVAVQAMRAGAADYLNKSQLTLDALERSLRHAWTLRAEERRFRALVENSSDALMLADEVGRLTYVAASVEQHLGWSADAMTGRSLLEFIHPDDRAIVGVRIDEALRHPGEAILQELRLRQSNGAWAVAEAVVVNRLDDASVRAIVVTARNVTDRRRLEDALRESQKMETIGQIADGVAQDLNNVMTAILGYCGLILDELPAGHPLRSDVEEVRAAGERAAEVTRQLLAFSRRRVVQPQIVDVNELVGQLEKLLRRTLGDQIALAIRCGQPVAPIRVDPSSLEQVILNLALNAKDAMSDGGRLTIEMTNAEIADTAESRLPDVSPPAGSYVRIAISDTTRGLDEETRRHLFEPFFTTRRHGRPSSLGLATAYSIVKQNGGYIFVTSRSGEGCVFDIYFRRVPIRPSGGADRRAWQTVLLVEEDDAVRALAREVLHREGYIVLEARRAADALRLAERHTDEIHALVTGQTLAHLTGPELARRLAEQRPQLKNAFLPKPFRPDALISDLRDALTAGR
ncbi:MAG TPA: response regulator [Vicinamibacterales bacterium]|nr:response regulator [Vicinamibacterales bacterium]